MTESEWLTSTDPAAMFKYLGDHLPLGTSARYQRRLRLFACACCRAVQGVAPCPRCGGTGQCRLGQTAGGTTLVSPRVVCPDCRGSGRISGLTDPRSRRAVEVVERYADGLATEAELRAARNLSAEVTGKEWPAHWTTSSDALMAALRMAFRSDFHTDTDNQYPPPAAQAALLRCLFGNPWRPGNLAVRWGQLHEHHEGCAPRVPPWITPTVVALARGAYDERDWSRLGPLADALEEAGCPLGVVCNCPECCTTNLLNHLRGGGPHARGCHAVDLILGRE